MTPLDAALTPLTREQRGLVAQFVALAQERFAPRAARHDAEASFPADNYQDLREAGLLGLTVPVAYSGLGADPPTYVLCLRAIAQACPATALTFNMHCVIMTVIAALGTAAQQKRYFAEVVERGKLVASITSEPTGSFRERFALGTALRHEPDGGYRVEGVKHFCSLGDAADYYFVSGILEGAASARAGCLSALLPNHRPGIKVIKPWNAIGMRGTMSHSISYNCRAEPDEIIGAPGGFLTADLSGFALGYAAVYLGIAEAAFQFILKHTAGRRLSSGGAPMSQQPHIQQAIGELGTSLEAGRLLLLSAAEAKKGSDRTAATLAVNQAKYYSAELGARVTAQDMRLAGGSGFLKDLPLERWHRDALAGPVMPPANERCLETIGKIFYGLSATTLEFE